MSRTSIIRVALGAALLGGCLSVPEPGTVVELDGGAVGGDADVAPCELELDFEDASELDGWEKLNADPGGCSCGIEPGALVFRNNGGPCDCYFQDPATTHDLRTATVGLSLGSRGAHGLSTALTVVLPDGRALFFAAAQGELYFGECTGVGTCDAGAYGSDPEGNENRHWRFRLENDDVLYEVSPDREAWEVAATAPNVEPDQANVWLQVGSFEASETPADTASVDDLRVCPP